MDFDEWNPVYDAICRDFGYDRAGDEHARDVLATLTGPFDLDRLAAIDAGTVAIAGAGPSIESERAHRKAASADVVIAASTAVDALEAGGIEVDCMVTDLDKNPETVRRLTHRGTPVAVHAHGDNVPAVRSVVPECADAYVLATTQAEPSGPVSNFGGFTDGDRAAFLADHLGADRLVFVGWDLDDPSVDRIKAKKLAWAERLLYWLERRRDERSGVLDGRRAAIETADLPID